MILKYFKQINYVFTNNLSYNNYCYLFQIFLDLTITLFTYYRNVIYSYLQCNCNK